MMPVSQRLALSVIGIVLGLGASFGLTRFMQNLLFGVTATDQAIFAAVAVLMLGAVGLASYLPARRATSVAPMSALRVD